jgi:hypothetical protein
MDEIVSLPKEFISQYIVPTKCGYYWCKSCLVKIEKQVHDHRFIFFFKNTFFLIYIDVNNVIVGLDGYVKFVIDQLILHK